MVIPEERDGKLEDDINLARDVTPAGTSQNTRKGGQLSKSLGLKKVHVLR